jgi:peroxiredoxin
MKIFPLLGAFVVLACLAPFSFAADPKAEKSPAEIAYTEVVKLLDDKKAQQDQARLNAVSKAGIAFVVTHGNYPRTGTVIEKMLQWTNVLNDKQRGLRSVFFAQVQGELLVPLFDETLSAESRAAVLALDSAMSEGLFRENKVPPVLQNWKQKIEAQMKQPSFRDLFKDRAAQFYDVMTAVNGVSAEKFLNEVVASGDKSAAGWAKAELKFAAVRKAPFELSFTGLDGTAFDISTLRGKVVCLFFWSAGTKDLAQKADALLLHVAEFGQKNFAVVSVCCDNEADREKVLAAVKSAKMKWPVYFDGQGEAGELCKKLNVTAKSLPVMLLIDQEGKLVKLPAGKLSFDAWALKTAVARLTQAKKK